MCRFIFVLLGLVLLVAVITLVNSLYDGEFVKKMASSMDEIETQNNTVQEELDKQIKKREEISRKRDEEVHKKADTVGPRPYSLTLDSNACCKAPSPQETYRLEREKEKKEEEKAKRIALLESRDAKIQARCFENGLYIYDIDKEHSSRHKEQDLPLQWTYNLCRCENIAHQVGYYSDEMARIIGIE